MGFGLKAPPRGSRPIRAGEATVPAPPTRRSEDADAHEAPRRRWLDSVRTMPRYRTLPLHVFPIFFADVRVSLASIAAEAHSRSLSPSHLST